MPRTYFNIFTVMLLGGLWHGPSLTYVCWGAIHGVALTLERLLGLNRPLRNPFGRVAWYLVVQLTAVFALNFFRTATIGGALEFIRNIGDLSSGPLNPDIARAALFMIPPIALHLYGFLVERATVAPLSRVGHAVLAGGLLFGVIVFHGEASEFIYFQF